jgi:hypothetical protein
VSARPIYRARFRHRLYPDAHAAKVIAWLEQEQKPRFIV